MKYRIQYFIIFSKLARNACNVFFFFYISVVTSVSPLQSRADLPTWIFSQSSHRGAESRRAMVGRRSAEISADRRISHRARMRRAASRRATPRQRHHHRRLRHRARRPAAPRPAPRPVPAPRPPRPRRREAPRSRPRQEEAATTRRTAEGAAAAAAARRRPPTRRRAATRSVRCLRRPAAKCQRDA